MRTTCLILVLAMFGCGGGGGSPVVDGGPAATDGGPAAADGARDAMTPDGCPPPPVMVLGARAWNLNLAADELVFVDLDAGGSYLAEKSRAVRKVKRDGTGDTTLYTAMFDHQIKDVWVSGPTAYFLENDRSNPLAEVTRVYSIPIAGGAHTLVVEHDDPAPNTANLLDAIVAIEGGSLFAVRGGSGATSKLWRIPIAGGVGALVTEAGIASRPFLQGGDFYFRDGAQTVAGSPGVNKLVKVPAAATNAPPATLGAAATRGDLIAGPYGMIGTGALETGGASVNVSIWDLSGAMHRQIFQYPVASRVPALGPADTTAVVVHAEISVPTTASGAFYKVPLAAGGTPTILACDRQQVRQRSAYESGSTHRAFVSQMDMVASGAELFWVERRGTAGGPGITHAIYRTTR